jgi:fucose 4-O-acetylase-like acetyltransferase
MNDIYIYLDVLRGISILIVIFAHYGLLSRFQESYIGTSFYIGGTHG